MMKTYLKVVCICFLFQMAYGQQYLLTIKNDVQSGLTYEFDMYIEAVGSTFELAGIQADFTFNNTGILNGGTATFTYVASSTEFTVTSQVPTGATVSSAELRLAEPSPPTAGSGQVIPLSPGLKVGRYRLTNTVAWTTATADVTWKTASNPYTKVFAFVGGLNTAITNAAWVANSLTNAGMPVELASFTASVNNLNAELKWSTATEVNNYGFEIERRAISDKQSAVSSWTKIGFVNGNGTSNVQHSYSFSDNITESGNYAYRLKQIDNSGAFKYSQELEVTIEVPKVFTLSQNYPNPFNPTTNIDFTVAADGKASLKVYNTLGQEVAELYNGVAQAGRIIQTHFNASQLASGIYFSRLEADGKSLVKRMMFIK